MRNAGMPNYRLSRCGLCKEVVLYRYPITTLSMPWNLITVWSLHRGGLCIKVILKRWLLSVP